VDLVTVHGKLEWEALGRTGRIVKKERHSLKGKKGGRLRGRIRGDRFVVV
jgi:hypothetical protein